MDKYKANSAFNKWFSFIQFEKLLSAAREKINSFDKYQKKLVFSKALLLFLYAINEEKESYRDIDLSMVSADLRKEVELESISYCQLSRILPALDPEVLMAIFCQLLEKVQTKKPVNKRNCLYLIDSSTFSLNKNLYSWADFRKTKSGVKLHLKLCFMDNENFYPDDFTITHAKEHDRSQLDVLVNKPEATYVYDRGYLDFKKMDEMHDGGYFFVTWIKKNTKVTVLETLEKSIDEHVLKDQMVTLGGPGYLTYRYHLVTTKDDKGKVLQFITNRLDWTSTEVAEAYKSRWQIELFFNHIKQHMTIKRYFSQSEQGMINQLILTMIASLLTYLIKLETKTTCTIFQIKRFFRYLIFQSAEEWLEHLVPT